MLHDGLDAFAVGLAAQVRDEQRWIVERGCLRRFGQRDPDLMRKLSTDLVELQRAEQADDGIRRKPANFGKLLMLGHLAVAGYKGRGRRAGAGRSDGA